MNQPVENGISDPGPKPINGNGIFPLGERQQPLNSRNGQLALPHRRKYFLGLFPMERKPSPLGKGDPGTLLGDSMFALAINKAFTPACQANAKMKAHKP